jgi:hypothetical protein
VAWAAKKYPNVSKSLFLINARRKKAALFTVVVVEWMGDVDSIGSRRYLTIMQVKKMTMKAMYWMLLMTKMMMNRVIESYDGSNQSHGGANESIVA